MFLSKVKVSDTNESEGVRLYVPESLCKTWGLREDDSIFTVDLDLKTHPLLKNPEKNQEDISCWN